MANGYLERESREIIEEIDSYIFATSDNCDLINRARWEIVRLREKIYEQTIELGLKDWEITELKKKN